MQTQKQPLTPRQRRFVDEYLIDLNATQAYIRAGYAIKNAHVSSSQLLANPSIQALVAQKQQKRVEKAEISADFVLNGLKENFARAMQQQPVLDAKGNETGEYQYEGAVANKSLELMGRHLRMWGDEKQQGNTTYIDARQVKFGDLDPDTRRLLSALARRLESRPGSGGGTVVPGDVAQDQAPGLPG